MRVMVYGLEPIMQDVVTGIRACGHKAFTRATKLFQPHHVEFCDLVIVDGRARNADTIQEAYAALEEGPPVAVIGEPYCLPEDGYRSLKLDEWAPLPECACPPDRAQAMGLQAKKCKIREGYVYLGRSDEPLARICEDVDLQAFLNRVAYGQWLPDEFAEGMPYAFMLNTMADLVEPFAEPAPKPEPEADDEPTLPEGGDIDTDVAVKVLLRRACARGITKLDLAQDITARGAIAVAADFGLGADAFRVQCEAVTL